MNRREFIGFAAVALGAAVVAPKLLLQEVPRPVTHTFGWTSCHSYKVGDVIAVSGFATAQNNGKYLCVALDGSPRFVPVVE